MKTITALVLFVGLLSTSTAFAQYEAECIQVTSKAAAAGIIKDTQTAKHAFYDDCMASHRAADGVRPQPTTAPAYASQPTPQYQQVQQPIPRSLQQELSNPRNGQRFLDLLFDAGYTKVHTDATVSVIKALVGDRGYGYGCRPFYPCL